MGPVEVDLDRMRRERHARLQTELAAAEFDAAVLLHGPHVGYATGLEPSGADAGAIALNRPVAVVVTGASQPHLFAGPSAVGLDAVMADPVRPDTDEGARELAGRLVDLLGDLSGRAVAVDELTGAMVRHGGLESARLGDAGRVVGAAKLRKSDDEQACIDEAQRRTELAMESAAEAIEPGMPRSRLAGLFLRRLHEIGGVTNLIDPIFQVMARRVADGPRTLTGDVAFPTGVGDPVFAEGDLVWVDAGVGHHGYASDFGTTWLVGRDPDAAETELFERWCRVMDATLATVAPGASLGDLTRAAVAADDGNRPWLPHFYLAHGVGIESAEMPLAGTDLGAEFDDRFELESGMVLVLEPVTWTDGVGGYRAEEIVVVTDDGWRRLGASHTDRPAYAR